MMKLFCLTILLCSCFTSFAQIDVIETDSSFIRIEKFARVLVVKETMKNRNAQYTKLRSMPDSLLVEEGWTDTIGTRYGNWKYYTAKGELQSSINYDDYSWEPNTGLYPNLDLLTKIKIAGENLIKATYGPQFFDRYVRFNPIASRFNLSTVQSSGGEQKAWTEPTAGRPVQFLLKYNIQYDSARLYESLIEIRLDSLGNLVVHPSKTGHSSPRGLEKKPGNVEFKLSVEEAIAIAKKNGLSTKTENIAFLRWDPSNKADSTGFNNGTFRLYLANFTKADVIPNTPNFSAFYYQVWVFNPWTKQFLEKKKVHTHFRLEERSASMQELEEKSH